VVVAVAIAVGISSYRSGAVATMTEKTSAQKTTEVSSQNHNTITIKQGASNKQNKILEPFSPSVLNIHVGDTVTWINEDSVSHTVDSIAFNSSELSPKTSNSPNSGGNPSSFKHTFREPGIFLYYSKKYPYMAGVIYVDTEETQRQLISTVTPNLTNVKIEMPWNSAYANKNGPFYIPVDAKVSEDNRITWENHDFIAHTATATDHSFDSGPVIPGHSFSTTAKGKGIIPYFCEIHPWMQGIVTIS
jgi:plastocyanin